MRLERICLARAYFFKNLVILSHILDDSRVLGTVHFLLGSGGLMGFEGGGGMPRNMASRGGRAGKIPWVKRGGHQKNSFKFCNDSICDNANNLPECQKIQKVQIFSGSMPPDPLLNYAQKTIKMRKKTYQMYRTIYPSYHCEKKISTAAIKKWNLSCR